MVLVAWKSGIRHCYRFGYIHNTQWFFTVGRSVEMWHSDVTLCQWCHMIFTNNSCLYHWSDPGLQCGLPESCPEGRAGRGSEAAGVQPNWQHHLLGLPVHHPRPVWVWQAHVHRSARLPGTKEIFCMVCFGSQLAIESASPETRSPVWV